MNERKTLEYYVLDVFSNKSYKGNPLSVVFTQGNLQPDEYSNIAREFGYSETSFVFYSTERKALDVRSFSPTGVEVGAGAGHNLLGAVCAAMLQGLPIFSEQKENHYFVLMGETVIPLKVSIQDNRTAVAHAEQKKAVIGQIIPADKIAKALGLSENDLKIDELVPTVVQTEVAHTMVPVKSLQLLNQCKPDNKVLIEISKKYKFEGFYCFTLAEPKQEHIAEARFFNPLIGIDEDAATGTAAGPLIGFLVKNNYIQLNTEYKILQGVKLNQPSLIETMVSNNGIRVGGASVVTMRGEIYLS